MGVIVTGVLALIVPAVCAAAVYHLIGDNWFALAAYVLSLIISIVVFVSFLRRTRAWEFEYDVLERERSRIERRMHPRRARYKRFLGQTLVWTPSLIAAFVLIFFAEISHIPHLGSRYLKYYRIPIPLNVAVLSFSGDGPGGYGAVEALVRNTHRRRNGGLYFWERDVTSILTFGDLGDEQAIRREYEAPFGTADVLRRDFRFGDVVLACRQYVYPAQTGLPYVSCQTAADVSRYNLYARFHGKEGDLPLFYSILCGITRLK